MSDQKQWSRRTDRFKAWGGCLELVLKSGFALAFIWAFSYTTIVRCLRDQRHQRNGFGIVPMSRLTMEVENG